jgi:SOS-response transcriptional repressor LexA
VKRHYRLTSVPLAGEIANGSPIDRASKGELVMIPKDRIDEGELVFRVRSPLPDLEIEPGDLLTVEPRNGGHAATGELVIVTVDERAFIGRWWNKRGYRALIDVSFAVITADKTMQLFGAITLIVRPSE